MDFLRLTIIREKKDLSQRQIAKILGVSKSTYARWETMEEIIPLPHLNNFCKYFKVTMDYVLNLSENNDYYLNSYSSEINKNIIGKNIKLIRKKHNLTQKDLADILNTSQSTISAYENGQTLFLTAFIYTLASKFNLSADKICAGQKNKQYITL